MIVFSKYNWYLNKVFKNMQKVDNKDDESFGPESWRSEDPN